MRKAIVKLYNMPAGVLIEQDKSYVFTYLPDYTGEPISLTMPVRKEAYEFVQFPPFFDGLLPEGLQLEGLLKTHKIDKSDYFSQLIAAGADLVGAVTITADE